MRHPEGQIQRTLPISEQLKRILRERILFREYSQADGQLPSEASLAAEFAVSRASVRTALAGLLAEGLVYKRKGVGTFVREASTLRGGIERLESIVTIAARQDVEMEVRKVEVMVLELDRSLSGRIDGALGEPLTRVTRTLHAGGSPLSYFDDFVLGDWLHPGWINSGFSGSVLDLLLQKHGSRLHEAIARITAVSAGERLSGHLEVASSDPLLLISETLIADTGRRIGYSLNYFVPGFIDFEVMRR